MATDGTSVLADIGGYTRFLTGVGMSTKMLRETFLGLNESCERARRRVAYTATAHPEAPEGRAEPQHLPLEQQIAPRPPQAGEGSGVRA